jgi:hypothetical protein
MSWPLHIRNGSFDREEQFVEEVDALMCCKLVQRSCVLK